MKHDSAPAYVKKKNQVIEFTWLRIEKDVALPMALQKGISKIGLQETASSCSTYYDKPLLCVCSHLPNCTNLNE